jgi:ATP-dependent Clp protease ATP-binding subunit ClpB
MTSNIGSHWIKELGPEAAKDRVMEELSRHFRPEFLNRVDEVIIFHALTMEDLLQIVEIQLRRLRALLAERDIGLELTEAAKRLLAEKGYDPVYGARPLKRTIQRELQDPLAMKILQGEFREGDTVIVDVRDDELVFTKQQRA